MRNIILKLLTETLHPTQIQLSDESAHHAGHNPAAKAGGTHFNLLIVSSEFEKKSPVQRHRMIYKILEGPLKSQVHALAITALTPQEYKT